MISSIIPKHDGHCISKDYGKPQLSVLWQINISRVDVTVFVSKYTMIRLLRRKMSQICCIVSLARERQLMFKYTSVGTCVPHINIYHIYVYIPVVFMHCLHNPNWLFHNNTAIIIQKLTQNRYVGILYGERIPVIICHKRYPQLIAMPISMPLSSVRAISKRNYFVNMTFIL